MVQRRDLSLIRWLAALVSVACMASCDPGPCEGIPAKPCTVPAPCDFGVEIDVVAGEECPDSSLVEVDCFYWNSTKSEDYPDNGLMYCMPEEELLERVDKCNQGKVPCSVREYGEEYGGGFSASCGEPKARCD